ncbi:MAG: hypothetical protein ACQEQD_04450 [Bacillota bacterium]
MDKRHINEYLHGDKKLKEICCELNINYNTFYKKLKEKGYKTRSKYYSNINTGIKELDKKLKGKYKNIVNRCRGNKGHKQKYYDGLNYLRVDEFVKFCNENKEKLNMLWEDYIENDKDRRLAVSIDRIDATKGYAFSNIQFVCYGYNSWRRNIRPIKIQFKGKWHYFMSAEEGARYFDVRRQSIGDLLRGKYRKISEDYTVKNSNTQEVLFQSKVDDTKGYYREYIFER